MTTKSFKTVEEALQDASSRIDHLCKCVEILDARCEAQSTAIYALIQSHQDHHLLRESYQSLYSITMANSQIHPGDNPGMVINAQEARDRLNSYMKAIDAQCRE